MSVPMYGAQKNYHFNVNQLSSSNPFNTNPTNTYNPYQPPKQQNAPLSQTKPLAQTTTPYTGNNSLYKNTPNKFISNMNPSSTMNFRDRVIAYGHDPDENYFKRSLRKSPIQSSSYNIITNLPYGTMSGTGGVRYDNIYNNQRRDHVADLLNYTTKTPYGYNNNNNNSTFKTTNMTARTPYTNNAALNSTTSPIASPVKIVDNIESVVSGLDALNNNNNANPAFISPTINNNNQQPRIPTGKPIASARTRSPSQVPRDEIISQDINEYYCKNAFAVCEYAYKEDSNSRYRGYMEDKGKSIDCFNKDANSALFCLFDGHGGHEVSKYLQDNFANEFKSALPSDNIESTFINVFHSIDEKIKASHYFNVGSTGCVVFITVENGKRILYVANVGDTRAVLIKQSQAKRLSYDDRASDKNEYNRIINSGGVVFAGRVYGQLMLSRAFGDWELKPYGVINVPHVLRMEIDMNDKYVVIASDGVWDVFEDEDIQKMVVNGEGTNADELCKNIIKNALLRGTMDNISCFVIKLN